MIKSIVINSAICTFLLFFAASIYVSAQNFENLDTQEIPQ